MSTDDDRIWAMERDHREREAQREEAMLQQMSQHSKELLQHMSQHSKDLLQQRSKCNERRSELEKFTIQHEREKLQRRHQQIPQQIPQPMPPPQHGLANPGGNAYTGNIGNQVRWNQQQQQSILAVQLAQQQQQELLARQRQQLLAQQQQQQQQLLAQERQQLQLAQQQQQQQQQSMVGFNTTSYNNPQSLQLNPAVQQFLQQQQQQLVPAAQPQRQQQQLQVAHSVPQVQFQQSFGQPALNGQDIAMAQFQQQQKQQQLQFFAWQQKQQEEFQRQQKEKEEQIKQQEREKKEKLKKARKFLDKALKEESPGKAHKLDSKWELRYCDAVMYFKKHKHLNVKSHEPGELGRLGHWIGSQRYQRKHQNMTEIRQSLLNRIGMIWDTDDNDLNAMLSEVSPPQEGADSDLTIEEIPNDNGDKDDNTINSSEAEDSGPPKVAKATSKESVTNSETAANDQRPVPNHQERASAPTTVHMDAWNPPENENTIIALKPAARTDVSTPDPTGRTDAPAPAKKSNKESAIATSTATAVTVKPAVCPNVSTLAPDASTTEKDNSEGAIATSTEPTAAKPAARIDFSTPTQEKDKVFAIATSATTNALKPAVCPKPPTPAKKNNGGLAIATCTATNSAGGEDSELTIEEISDDEDDQDNNFNSSEACKGRVDVEVDLTKDTDDGDDDHHGGVVDAVEQATKRKDDDDGKDSSNKLPDRDQIPSPSHISDAAASLSSEEAGTTKLTRKASVAPMATDKQGSGQEHGGPQLRASASATRTSASALAKENNKGSTVAAENENKTASKQYLETSQKKVAPSPSTTTLPKETTGGTSREEQELKDDESESKQRARVGQATNLTVVGPANKVTVSLPPTSKENKKERPVGVTAKGANKADTLVVQDREVPVVNEEGQSTMTIAPKQRAASLLNSAKVNEATYVEKNSTESHDSKKASTKLPPSKVTLPPGPSSAAAFVSKVGNKPSGSPLAPTVEAVEHQGKDVVDEPTTSGSRKVDVVVQQQKESILGARQEEYNAGSPANSVKATLHDRYSEPSSTTPGWSDSRSGEVSDEAALPTEIGMRQSEDNVSAITQDSFLDDTGSDDDEPGARDPPVEVLDEGRDPLAEKLTVDVRTSMAAMTKKKAAKPPTGPPQELVATENNKDIDGRDDSNNTKNVKTTVEPTTRTAMVKKQCAGMQLDASVTVETTMRGGPLLAPWLGETPLSVGASDNKTKRNEKDVAVSITAADPEKGTEHGEDMVVIVNDTDPAKLADHEKSSVQEEQSNPSDPSEDGNIARKTHVTGSEEKAAPLSAAASSQSGKKRKQHPTSDENESIAEAAKNSAKDNTTSTESESAAETEKGQGSTEKNENRCTTNSNLLCSTAQGNKKQQGPPVGAGKTSDNAQANMDKKIKASNAGRAKLKTPPRAIMTRARAKRQLEEGSEETQRPRKRAPTISGKTWKVSARVDGQLICVIDDVAAPQGGTPEVEQTAPSARNETNEIVITPEPAATTGTNNGECACCSLSPNIRDSFPELARWMVDNGRKDLMNNHFPHGEVEACSSGKGGVKKRRKQQRSQRRGKGRQKSTGDGQFDQLALCGPCQSHWKTKAAEYCSLRESQLMDPLDKATFHEPIFKVGGVSTEYMKVFISIKKKLANTPARMKDFEGLTKTKGAGKFQYFVKNHAASEKRWHWKDAKLLENCPYETTMLEKFAMEYVAPQLPMGRGSYRMDAGFVMTNKAFVQEPHRDYKGYAHIFKHTCGKEAGLEKQPSGQTCGCADKNKPETRFFPWIIHLPLCKEGMWLNYWPDGDRSKPPLRIFIPFGTFLAARADGVHGGLFGGVGNVRYHFSLTPLKDAIRAKGDQWKREGQKLSDEVIRRHCKLGAHESGQDPRELDHLKEDFSSYCCPDEGELGKCRAGHPLTYADPGYLGKVLQETGEDAELSENMKLK